MDVNLRDASTPGVFCKLQHNIHRNGRRERVGAVYTTNKSDHY